MSNVIEAIKLTRDACLARFDPETVSTREEQMNIVREELQKNFIEALDVEPIAPDSKPELNPIEHLLNGALSMSSTLGIPLDLIEVQKFHSKVSEQKPTFDETLNMLMETDLFPIPEELKQTVFSMAKQLFYQLPTGGPEETPAEGTPAEGTPAEASVAESGTADTITGK